MLQSIARAHDDLDDGELLFGAGELLNASISRSPYAYDQNPQAERDRCVRPPPSDVTKPKKPTTSFSISVIDYTAIVLNNIYLPTLD